MPLNYDYVIPSGIGTSDKGYAPIALFIFRRPDHLTVAIRSLLACRGIESTPIIVFGDGPRNSGDNAGVDAARAVAQELLGGRAEFRFYSSNRGLAGSVISGVSDVLCRFGRVIVLEDDLEMSPDFLVFMNSALDKYADEGRVFQVSGHMFDVPDFQSRSTAVILPLTTSWGWATWDRAWAAFDPGAAGAEELRCNRALRRRFNIEGAYDYSGMLERQMHGTGNSWAILWYWSVFRQSGLAVFPPRTLVRNIGVDGSGTHGRGLLSRFRGGASPERLGAVEWPACVETLPTDLTAVRRAIWKQNRGWLGYAADVWRRMSWTKRVLSSPNRKGSSVG